MQVFHILIGNIVIWFLLPCITCVSAASYSLAASLLVVDIGKPVERHSWKHIHDLVLIEARWRIYASPTEGIIGSDNGSAPVWRQAII